MQMTFKALRLKSGLTPEQMAKKLDLSKSAYAKIESASRQPSPKVLIKMKDAYATTSDEILEALESNEEYKSFLRKYKGVK